MSLCGTPLLRLLPLLACVWGPRKRMWGCRIPGEDLVPPWQGARPWPLPAPLGRLCASSYRGEWDGVCFGGAFLPPTVYLGCAGCEAGANSRAGVGSLLPGQPRFILGRSHLAAVSAPHALWSLLGGFGRAAERAFYPGILLLPCVFIHCPQLEAPALALSIK